MALTVASLLAALLLPGTAPDAPSGAIYNGRQRETAVAPPRLEAEVTVDGALDEPAWRQAALLTGFSQYAPVDGHPADDSTEVLVWYSPTAIHFGVRAFAQPGTVRATLADRDRIDADDQVTIFLGTFNDARQAFALSVNPLGVQADGTILDGGAASSGGFGGMQQGRPMIDATPDFVYQSKGRLTEWGYEVEIRVPFRSLKFQGAATQTWGFNVVRRVQSRGHEDSWTPAVRAGASYLGQFGTLAGLTGLDRGRVLEINPVMTARADGAPSPTGGYAYDGAGPRLGANARWGVTPNLMLSATVRPDFAEVESDATQFQADPRYALRYPEKRPFFLDGIEQFSTPSNIVYTRRIVSPLAAAKLTGKVAGTTVAFLSAVDDQATSASGTDRPVHTVLRVQRDFGAASRAGLVYTGRDESGDVSNHLLGADARFVMGKIYSAQLQAVGSRTTAPGVGEGTAPLWAVVLGRSGRRLVTRYALSGVDENFRAGSGFVSRPGVANGSLDHLVTWFGPKGAFVESVSEDVVLAGTWQYHDFVRGRDAQDKKLHFNTNASLRGGWQVGGALLVESFGFDDRYYSSYAVERHTAAGVDTVPFTGTPRLPNRDWLVQVTTPQFKHVAAHLFYLWGQDENFDEWSSARVGIVNASVDWRPTDKLRASGTYDYQYYDRLTDGSRVRDNRIPRLKVEYQLARPLLVRVVGEYTASFQDDLRDDSRTGDPILLRTGRDTYVRATAARDNRFRGDALLAYQPSPGTVFFAGYGSTMTEPDALRFRNLARERDAFFVKASYVIGL